MIKYMYSINIFLSAILSSPLIIFFYLIKFIIPKELWFRIIKYIIRTWYNMVIFYMIYILKIKVIINSDDIKIEPKDKKILFFSNHPSFADWLYFWIIAYKYNRVKDVIIAMKDPIRRVPGIGWAVELLEYAFISRNNKLMDINELKNTVKQDNIFFLIFPEGTNFGVEKLKTQLLQYNLNDDLKLICNEYTDVLIPKTSGLRTCIKNGNFDKIYTLTICYSKLPSIQTPTLWSAWMGIYPKEILFNIENFKYEKNDIDDEKKFKKLIYENYKSKNQYLKNNNNYINVNQDKIIKGNIEICLSMIIWIIMTIIILRYMYINKYVLIIEIISWITLYFNSKSLFLQETLKFKNKS